MPDEMTAEEVAAALKERDDLKAALQTQQRETWRAKALDEFKLAAKFADQISGDTEEAVKASAKQLHESIQALIQEAVDAAKPQHEQAAARAAYGTPAAGGGGKPPEGQKDELQAMTDEVQNFLTGKGPRPTKETFDQFVTKWGQRAVLNRLANPSSS